MKRLRLIISAVCAVFFAVLCCPAAFAAQTLLNETVEKVQGAGTGTAVLFLAVLILIFVSMAFVVRQGRSGHANVPWAILAILLAGLALAVGVVGYSFGTLYTKPDGDPGETVELFFSSVEKGDYPTAYSCLNDYTGLGLENLPADENGGKVYQALKDSYSHNIMGKATVDKLSAFVPVRFRYLNIKDTESRIQEEVGSVLKQYVAENPHNKIYDENEKYLPEVTDMAYSEALDTVMNRIENFYTTEQLNVELVYRDGQWYIVTSPQMLNALIGGTAQ